MAERIYGPREGCDHKTQYCVDCFPGTEIIERLHMEWRSDKQRIADLEQQLARERGHRESLQIAEDASHARVVALEQQLAEAKLPETQAALKSTYAYQLRKLEQQLAQAKEAFTERVAILTAHRACLGIEHDPANGKLHGCCVVCGVSWPCEYALASQGDGK